MKHFCKRKYAKINIRTLDAGHGNVQRWMHQTQRPTHWQSIWSENPFKTDRSEAKDIQQARVVIHEHKHAIIIKNECVKRPPRLHLPLARIRWVLRPYKDRGPHGAQLWLIMKACGGHETMAWHRLGGLLSRPCSLANGLARAVNPSLEEGDDSRKQGYNWVN